MKKLSVLIIALSLAKVTFSADEGTLAASFMKIDSSARPAALAGAFSALADDATAIHYNPAGIGFLNQKEVSFSHNEWFESIRLESLSYAHPVGDKWTLGLGVNYLFTDSVRETTSTGVYTGDTFSGSGGTIMVGIAGRVNDYFSFGINAKTIGEKLADRSDYAFGGDAGFLFKKSFTDGFFSAGGSIENFGTKIKLYEDSFDIPLKYCGGFALGYRYFVLTVVADKARDTDLIMRSGVEFNSKDLIKEARLALRLGYRTETPDEAGAGITMGVGVGVENFALDYAFVPMGELGSTHRVTLSVKFGKVRGYKEKQEIPAEEKTPVAEEKAPEELLIPELEQEVTEVTAEEMPAEVSSKEKPLPEEKTKEAEVSEKIPESEGIILTEEIDELPPKPAEPKTPSTELDNRFEKPRKISAK